MINIRRAENFGKLMGKIAAGNQPVAPGGQSPQPYNSPDRIRPLDGRGRPLPVPPDRSFSPSKNPTLNELWASRQAPTMQQQASDYLSHKGLTTKQQDLERLKETARLGEQKSFPTKGLEAEKFRQKSEQDQAAFNTMASTLGVSGASRTAGHYLGKILAPAAQAAQPHLANTVGHTASNLAVQHAPKALGHLAGHTTADAIAHGAGMHPAPATPTLPYHLYNLYRSGVLSPNYQPPK
jgi:hypothetical protein